MGLLRVVSRVPMTTILAGDRMSARVPLRDLEALHRNCAIACKLPICAAMHTMLGMATGRVVGSCPDLGWGYAPSLLIDLS